MRYSELELQIINHFEQEYNRLVNLLKEPPTWLSKSEAIQNCLQRCLGAAEFANAIGVEFSLVEALMDGQRERCYKL